MERYTDLPFTISKKEVLEQLSCGADSECYEEFADEYEALLSETLEICRPEILLAEGEVPPEAGQNISRGSHAVYAFWTVGRQASSFSSRFFSRGDYVKGMLADAMVDSALFSLEEDLKNILKEYCEKSGCGISRRLEAPQDIPMEMQKVIFEKTEGYRFGIEISSGYMFEPVKSSACLFLLTGDQDRFETSHDCASCPNLSCLKRNVDRIQVRILLGNGEYTVQMKAGTDFMESVSAAGIELRRDCGRTGRCGKCRMRIEKGVMESSIEDERFFTETELKEGWRLACRACPQMNLTVRMEKQEEALAVLTERITLREELSEEDENCAVKYEECGIAVDIGTTTLAMQKTGLASGRMMQVWTGVNHQRRFGTDVMSRIGAACQGKLEELQKCIQEDLRQGFQELLDHNSENEVKCVVIAGNTAMLHFLLGFSCEGLSRVPFIPCSLEERKGTLKELIHRNLPDISVTILPGISSFIGADITAGLYCCRFAEREKVNFFIDLGTNGEMAIGGRERILCASTAAGPALEGGNISCGTASLPGAVSHVEIRNKKAVVETISGAEPNGICGSGVLDTVSELYRTGMMDETGRLIMPYFESGYCLTDTAHRRICFTQRDVREIQLAKAAIRAGIETLLRRCGVCAEEIDSVYLAGGLGFSLDLEKAFAIGLFPEAFRGRIISSGNTCLGGCTDYMRYREKPKLQEQLQKAEVLDLAADPVFQESYIEHMLFGEEE